MTPGLVVRERRLIPVTDKASKNSKLEQLLGKIERSVVRDEILVCAMVSPDGNIGVFLDDTGREYLINDKELREKLTYISSKYVKKEIQHYGKAKKSISDYENLVKEFLEKSDTPKRYKDWTPSIQLSTDDNSVEVPVEEEVLDEGVSVVKVSGSSYNEKDQIEAVSYNFGVSVPEARKGLQNGEYTEDEIKRSIIWLNSKGLPSKERKEYCKEEYKKNNLKEEINEELNEEKYGTYQEAVKELMVRKWISGKGGISDSAFKKAYEKINKMFDVDFDKVSSEFDRQIDVLSDLYENDKVKYNKIKAAAEAKKDFIFEELNEEKYLKGKTYISADGKFKFKVLGKHKDEIQILDLKTKMKCKVELSDLELAQPELVEEDMNEGRVKDSEVQVGDFVEYEGKKYEVVDVEGRYYHLKDMEDGRHPKKKVVTGFKKINEEYNPFKDLKKLPVDTEMKNGLYTDGLGGVYEAPKTGKSSVVKIDGYSLHYDFKKREIQIFYKKESVGCYGLSLSSWLDNPRYWCEVALSKLEDLKEEKENE